MTELTQSLHSSVAPPFAGDSCLICAKRLLMSVSLASQNCWRSQLIANADRWCVVKVLTKLGSLDGPRRQRGHLPKVLSVRIRGLMFTKAFTWPEQKCP